MKAFSLCWRSSTKARKQRKYIVNAPLHIRHRFVSMHLSPELRKKHGTRNLPARKGDTIKILRGSLAGRTGKIDHIEDEKIFVGGIENTRKDGSKSLIPLQPSNLMLTEIVLEDKKRSMALERKTKRKDNG